MTSIICATLRGRQLTRRSMKVVELDLTKHLRPPYCSSSLPSHLFPPRKLYLDGFIFSFFVPLDISYSRHCSHFYYSCQCNGYPPPRACRRATNLKGSIIYFALRESCLKLTSEAMLGSSKITLAVASNACSQNVNSAGRTSCSRVRDLFPLYEGSHWLLMMPS